MNTAFEARFPGTCAKGDRIHPGDVIRYGEGNAVEHVHCDDDTEPHRTEKSTKFQGTSLDDMGY